MESVAKKPLLSWQLKIILSLVLTLATGILLHALGKPIPWQLEMSLTTTSALGVGMALLFIPKKQLARIGQIPGLNPNWITFWGFYFWYVGLAYFYITHDLYGLTILSGIGGVLDVVDGKMATAMKEEGIFRTALSKKLGKVADPFADKSKCLPVITFFGIAGIISIYTVIAIVVFEVFGTLLRYPFGIGARFYKQSKRTAPSWRKAVLRTVGIRLIRKSQATIFGKIKTTIQCLGMLVCVPYYRKWCHDLPEIPEIIYALALAFGITSVLSRMRISPAVDRIIDWPRKWKLFTHKEHEFSGALARLN
ncbi:MAG: CDP-alcohol phosphatidyltransferase family protein [Patescibacteria group bacterium]|nr:CDP-alcohol phosphatidyltransferase family protein [Patescibacteria group bacterium]